MNNKIKEIMIRKCSESGVGIHLIVENEEDVFPVKDMVYHCLVGRQDYIDCGIVLNGSDDYKDPYLEDKHAVNIYFYPEEMIDNIIRIPIDKHSLIINKNRDINKSLILDLILNELYLNFKDSDNTRTCIVDYLENLENPDIDHITNTIFRMIVTIDDMEEDKPFSIIFNN